MKNASVGSIRVRLALVFLLALVPALALLYFNARQQRDAASALAEDDVGRIARLTAVQNTRVVEGARQLLVAVAQLPEVRSGDAANCSGPLKRLVEECRFYSDLGVVNSAGKVLCSAVPLQEPLSVADRPWFRQAMKTGDFTVGEYEAKSFAGLPALTFGYPILGSDNRVQYVVFASLDLYYLSQQLSLAMPPEGAELAMVDRACIVLAQAGTAVDRVGHASPEAGRIKAITTFRGRGTERGRDSDGVDRIYAFYPIGGKREGADTYVTASMPADIAFAAANRQLNRNLAALLIVALLGLAAAWYGGESIVLRQTNAELEQRVQERTRELEHEQFLLRTLLDNIPDSIYFKDKNGRFLRSSAAQAKRFGLSDPTQAIGKTDFDFFSKQHAEEALADEQRIIQNAQALVGVEEFSPLTDGTERWVSTSKLPLRDKSGTIVGTFGISREITERKRAERTLAGERNLLRTLVDNLPDLVFIKDTRGRYVFDNPAHRSLLGVTKLEDVAGKTLFDFYPKELATQLHADDDAVMASEKPVINREESLTDVKGRKLRSLTSKVPYRDEQSRIAGLICICRVLGEPK